MLMMLVMGLAILLLQHNMGIVMGVCLLAGALEGFVVTVVASYTKQNTFSVMYNSSKCPTSICPFKVAHSRFPWCILASLVRISLPLKVVGFHCSD